MRRLVQRMRSRSWSKGFETPLGYCFQTGVRRSIRIEPKYTINYAVSLNGIDWIPRGIAIDLENDEGGISQASVIQDNDKYIMYFSVRDNDSAKKNIATIKKFIKNNCFLPNAEPIEQPK